MSEQNKISIPFDESVHENSTDYLIDDRPGGTRVYRAVSNGSSDLYAVKVVPAASISFRKPHNPRNEAALLVKLSHPNILNLVSAFYKEDSELYELRMPYVELPLSSILDNPYFSSQPFPSELQLQSPSPFPIDRLSYLHEILSKSILFQILSAVAYLHTQKDPIAHRDINPGNFLLTPTGLVKLIDFSISWDPSLGDILIAGESSQDEDFYWKEDPKEMCVQIATGSYRSPELLYSDQTYDPYATDLWSLGVLVASFFSPLELYVEDDGEDSYSEDSSLSGNEETIQPTPQTPPFIIPKGFQHVSPRDEWTRKPIFDLSKGEIGFIWSIFSIMGTPTNETWPDFAGNRPGSMIKFKEAPKQDLRPLLPHLPAESNSILQIIEGFLTYPPNHRLRAEKALESEWFSTGACILLPTDYPTVGNRPNSAVRELDGHDFTNVIHVLVEKERKRIEEIATLRDEWD